MYKTNQMHSGLLNITENALRTYYDTKTFSIAI